MSSVILLQGPAISSQSALLFNYAEWHSTTELIVSLVSPFPDYL